MRRTDFRDLLVWQKSKAICLDLYRATNNFPSHEKFGIVSQIRNAAVSVPLNIAEGHGRSSDADFSRFLYISLGSVKELETLVDIAEALSFLETGNDFSLRLTEISKMLSGLISTLKSNAQS